MDKDLQKLIEVASPGGPEADAAWVDEMRRRYPYMVLPAMAELRAGVADATRRRELMRHVALCSPTPEALYRLLEPDAPDASTIYPPERQPETPSTQEAIETFMERYGDNDPRQDELLERLIFNPVADYSRVLADEEERSLPSPEQAEGESQDSLINAFILKSRNAPGHFPRPDDPILPAPAEPSAEVAEGEVAPPAEGADASLLSESLAKIFIKQGRYRRAHEIISTLSLKYPEKSVYFADQLRFLQKLIINQQYQTHKKQ